MQRAQPPVKKLNLNGNKTVELKFDASKNVEPDLAYAQRRRGSAVETRTEEDKQFF